MNVIYRIHLLLSRFYKQFGLKDDSIIAKFTYLLFYFLINWIYSIELRIIILGKNLGISNPNFPSITISMTTFPSRIKYILPTLISLISQKNINVKVVLYLSKEEFSNDLKDVPKKIKMLERYGLSLKFVDLNLLPHNKYFHAGLIEPSDEIYTADDDIIYPSYLFRELYNEFNINQQYLIISRGHKVKYDRSGFVPYSEWDHDVVEVRTPSFELFPTSVGGQVIPLKLYGDKLFDNNRFMKLTPKSDDLWLYAMSIIYKIPIKTCDRKYSVLFNVIGSQKNSLANYNILDNGNDLQLSRLNKEYQLVEKLYLINKSSMTKSI